MTNQTETSVAYYDPQTCDLGEFKALIDQETRPETVPHAMAVEKNIPIYDMITLRAALDDVSTRRALMAEWAQVLRNGAGVLVLKSAYADTEVLDRATAIYADIIAREKAGTGGGA